MDSKTIAKHLRECEKKADKYWNEYQQSGSASTSRTYDKYSELASICSYAMRMKLKEEKEESESGSDWAPW